MFPDTIRKNLMFDLNYALRHRCTGLKWQRNDPCSEIAAETLVKHLEGSNYFIIRGPSHKPATTPGPTIEFQKAHQALRERYLKRINDAVSDGLGPEDARAFGEKMISDLCEEELFRPFSDADFKRELVDFGAMLLQLSHYRSRQHDPAAALAFENIWHVLYHYKKKEAPPHP